jgi:hypothetical protein
MWVVHPQLINQSLDEALEQATIHSFWIEVV